MLTAHLVIAESNRQGSIKEVESVLHGRFAITHTTLQFEDPATAEVCPQQPDDRV